MPIEGQKTVYDSLFENDNNYLNIMGEVKSTKTYQLGLQFVNHDAIKYKKDYI